LLFCRAALPLPRQALTFAAGLIRRHPASIGSLWRKLNPGQALLVSVHLRKGEPFAQAAAGCGVGTATAWRYMTETVALLAARAPKLRQAVRAAKKARYPFAVLDGTLIRTDRVAADRPLFSSKHHCHGMNMQVIAGPAGQLTGVSGALPGAVHDMRAAWIRGIERELAATGLPALAAQGYQGAVHARTPYRGKGKPESQKRPTAPTRNSAPPERGQPRSSSHGRSSASYAAALAGRPDRPGRPRSSSHETKAG
jgi:hypothetical protein